MRSQFAVIVGAVVVFLTAPAVPSLAEEKIQAVVTSNGRIVFTNLLDSSPSIVDKNPPLVDNAPAPPPSLFPASVDIIAEEIPASLRTLVDTISANHGVDPALVRAVIKTESNFNRWAISNKGA